MLYINIKENGKVKTLDCFGTYKEAKEMLKEYKLSSSYYITAYVSSRSTKDWLNR